MRPTSSRMALVALAGLWPLALAGAAPKHPNVVVVLTDDQGWGDLGVNGNTNLRTPHVDSLARDGAGLADPDGDRLAKVPPK